MSNDAAASAAAASMKRSMFRVVNPKQARDKSFKNIGGYLHSREGKVFTRFRECGRANAASGVRCCACLLLRVVSFGWVMESSSVVRVRFVLLSKYKCKLWVLKMEEEFFLMSSSGIFLHCQCFQDGLDSKLHQIGYVFNNCNVVSVS